jgi:hypothetical protein
MKLNVTAGGAPFGVLSATYQIGGTIYGYTFF